MAKYSEEFKYSIVMKMMPPQNQSVSEIARETGLSEGTLYLSTSKRLGSS
jgi:transposase